MIRLNVHEAKTHLSRYLKRLTRGETILLCRRNVPIAEIRPLPGGRTSARCLGLAKEAYGAYQLPASFFEPLPPDLLRDFEGDA